MVRPDPKQLLGKTLGGVYQITRHVASGGFSEVYEALHVELETPVAIKVHRPPEPVDGNAAQTQMNDDYSFGHFKTEAILGARLRHPSVVRVLDFRSEAKCEYIVLEWLDGQSLGKLADGRAMHWRRAAELVAQACEAVAILHDAGWLHRDIKPDNFMVVRSVSGEETVVVIDLGLVRHQALAEPIVSALAEPTAWICHTPGYCAPEVYSKSGTKFTESPFSEASEVFALGVTLFRLVAGRLPWVAKEARLQQLALTVGEPPKTPAEFGVRLPTDLETLIMRAIAHDPASRPASAKELALALRRLLEPTKRVVATRIEAPPVSEHRPHLSPAIGDDAVTAKPPTPRPNDALPVVAPAPAWRPPRWFWAPPLVLLALIVGELAVPLPARVAVEDLVEPAPVPAYVVRPAAPPTVPVKPATAEPIDAPRPKLDVPRPRPSLEQLLRTCAGAPVGPVVFEVRDQQLVSIDFEALVTSDPWHACAARRLAGTRDGRRVVDL